MDAQEYDPRRAKRRKRLVATCALIALAGFIVWLLLRHWPEKHAVDRFFHAIEAGNLEQAYALYTGDAKWQQHPSDHQNYTLEQFRLDWGPGGDYGAITSHHIECVIDPPRKSSGPASGVIVVARVNGRRETRSLWVKKRTKSITVSPLECTPDCRQCQF